MNPTLQNRLIELLDWISLLEFNSLAALLPAWFLFRPWRRLAEWPAAMRLVIASVITWPVLLVYRVLIGLPYADWIASHRVPWELANDTGPNVAILVGGWLVGLFWGCVMWLAWWLWRGLSNLRVILRSSSTYSEAFSPEPGKAWLAALSSPGGSLVYLRFKRQVTWITWFLIAVQCALPLAILYVSSYRATAYLFFAAAVSCSLPAWAWRKMTRASFYFPKDPAGATDVTAVQ